MRFSHAAVLLATLALAIAPPVPASTITELSNADAIVRFDMASTGLEITVTNRQNVAAIEDTLTAVRFVMTGAPALTLASVDVSNAEGSPFYTCSGSGNNTKCSSSTTGPAEAMYNWIVSSSSPYTVQTNQSDNKPGAIVNSSILANGKDGLGNARHIPYLGGPVTFGFSGDFSTAVLDPETVYVHFGTSWDSNWSVLNSVPEPATSLLVGLALLGLGWRRSRRA